MPGSSRHTPVRTRCNVREGLGAGRRNSAATVSATMRTTASPVAHSPVSESKLSYQTTPLVTSRTQFPINALDFLITVRVLGSVSRPGLQYLSVTPSEAREPRG